MLAKVYYRWLVPPNFKGFHAQFTNKNASFSLSYSFLPPKSNKFPFPTYTKIKGTRGLGNKGFYSLMTCNQIFE